MKFHLLFLRLRSYHEGNTVSRPISAVKLHWALPSTLVGDQSGTESAVDFLYFFFFFPITENNKK